MCGLKTIDFAQEKNEPQRSNEIVKVKLDRMRLRMKRVKSIQFVELNVNNESFEKCMDFRVSSQSTVPIGTMKTVDPSNSGNNEK